MKQAEQKVAEGEMVTGNFTIQATMPMGKTITVSGYIYAHNTPESVNKQVDFLHDVIDRQRTRSEIPELEAKMDQRYNAIRDMRDHLANLKEKQTNTGKLSSAEKKMIDDMSTSIAKVSTDIDKGMIAIQEAKRKTGM